MTINVTSQTTKGLNLFEKSRWCILRVFILAYHVRDHISFILGSSKVDLSLMVCVAFQEQLHVLGQLTA